MGDKPLNTPCGTIHFTAPEVLQSYDYTTAADMWSLGVIIFLLVCGFPPFFDNQGNEQKLFQIIKKAKFSFPKLYFDDKHPSLKELITDLIKKRPIERLTCEEVRKCEWLTGIKQPKKKMHNFINPFLDNSSNGNANDNGNVKAQTVNNPFLNSQKEETKATKWVPPYMRQQSQPPKVEPKKVQADVLPPYMQQQQQQQNGIPGPPPPGSNNVYRQQQQQQYAAPGAYNSQQQTNILGPPQKKI